jgi:hypothetical protein
LVVGPEPGPEALRAWDRGSVAHLTARNDIVCDFAADGVDLEALWPPGWTPDLVVGISGVGGDPLYDRVAELPYPTAFLSIDTWQCLLDYREALKYDFVFAAQREFVPHLRATGSRHVFWLPLACDPEAHFPAPVEPTHDVAFAGSASRPVHRDRRRLLDALAGQFSVLAREAVFGDALCALSARGRLVFNHAAVQELNMRVFETLAMGRPLLTNAESAVNGLLDLFEDGRHLLVYHSEQELLDKARRYLADEDARQAIANAGRAEVLARHTYAHRVQTLLDMVRSHTARFEATPKRRGEDLQDYLPTVPGAVVDLGLLLEASKVALRRRGVTRLTGVPADVDSARRRSGSYDDMAALMALPDGAADTVVAASSPGLGLPLEDLLWQAHRLLTPGGTLVLRLSPADLSQAHLKPDAASLGQWLQQREFHVRRADFPGPEGGGIVQARKRTRTLASVVAEVFERLQVPEIDLPGLLARIPSGW